MSAASNWGSKPYPRVVNAAQLALDIEVRKQREKLAKINREITDMESELADFVKARKNVEVWIAELEEAIALVPTRPSTEYDA